MSAAPKGKKKPAARSAPTMSSHPWWIAGLVGLALAGLTAWAWPPRDAPERHVVRGNQMYVRQQYREALGEYEAAPGAGTRYAGVQLDRGLARFRVHVPPGDAGTLPMLPPDAGAPEGLAQAQDEMRTAARGGTTGAAEDVDRMMRARAAYDLANTHFSSHQWDNAIESYKASLRLRPGWTDAAWNLELARRLREAERNPPDAGQDSGSDASDGSPDSGPPDAGHDGGMDSGTPDGGSPDGTSSDSGAGDSGGGDSGGDGQGGPDGGASNDGGGASPDAGTPPDAGLPRSMAPLEDLDRSVRSLQNEMLRRRGVTPRGPDDDR